MAASSAFNTSKSALQQCDHCSNNVKRWVTRRTKRVTEMTILAAVIAEVTAIAGVAIITETIKTATIVKVRDLPSGIGRLVYPMIQPRSKPKSSVFNELMIAI